MGNNPLSPEDQSAAQPISPLLVVAGPTGSGKSSLSISLAERFDGEIINCDSIQVYRGLDIGSAKISVAERHGIPHHLLDIAHPQENVTAGSYARLAREALDDIRRRGRVPIVVGGTGLYLRALLEGLSPAPQRDEKLRARLRRIAERRPAHLHHLLKRRDPDAAERIHPNDHQKLIRAVELMALAGQPASATQKAPRNLLKGFRTLKLGLSPDRKLLYEHLNARALQMFAHGLVDETRKLLEQGVSPESKALQSLGYRQAIEVLSGNMSLDDAVRECQTKTRQYAKRQMTWFRREQGMDWLHGFGTEEHIRSTALELTEGFLRRNSTPSTFAC
jgi:tRNA dimethylallyltransferase